MTVIVLALRILRGFMTADYVGMFEEKECARE